MSLFRLYYEGQAVQGGHAHPRTGSRSGGTQRLPQFSLDAHLTLWEAIYDDLSPRPDEGLRPHLDAPPTREPDPEEGLPHFDDRCDPHDDRRPGRIEDVDREQDRADEEHRANVSRPGIRPCLYKAGVAQCDVCGVHVEERGFQVLVAGRPSAYDRIECAERGRVLAGGAAFVHPFKARTIVIDAPRTAVAAVASAGVAGSLLARASLARAKLAFGGAWLLATGLAATSLYLWTRPDSVARSTRSGAAEASTGVEESASSVPFVHQADLPPVRVGGRPARPAGTPKPKPQPLLVRNDAGNQPSPVATPPAPPPSAAPSSGPSQEPPSQEPPSQEPPPPAIQPVEPPPPAVPATPPVIAPAGDDDEDSTKPGWGHGDDNHEHSGPRGKDKDR